VPRRDTDLQGVCHSKNKNDHRQMSLHMEKKIKLSDPAVDTSVVTQVKPLDKYFICPITHEIMKDPVIASDGHTYERSAIKKWRRNNEASPITRAFIENTFVTNFSMRLALYDLGYPLIDPNQLTAKKVLRMLRSKNYSKNLLTFSIQDSETNVESLLNLGYIAEYMDGDHEKAKEIYLKAIDLGSNNALVDLGYIYERVYGSLYEAEKSYLKAYEFSSYARGFKYYVVRHLSIIYKKLSETIGEKAESIESESDSDSDSD
jgi:tetratricopeptide (TPR) repeat protein